MIFSFVSNLQEKVYYYLFMVHYNIPFVDDIRVIVDWTVVSWTIPIQCPTKPRTIITLPKANIASEKWWLGNCFTLGKSLFSVDMLVSGRVSQRRFQWHLRYQLLTDAQNSAPIWRCRKPQVLGSTKIHQLFWPDLG